ncbi:GntR family transcriptional regulator [Massilia aurea]|uniref:GntR family transcriptional regulator n=1 Tax=Massilia aurea TaxID=373040 RepID=UPI003462585D
MDFLDTAFRLDRSRNATAQVFEHLRELIVGLAIKPGTVLARPQLCDYYNLSLSPVREALLRLEEEHLVDIFPQHQTRVRCIDLAQARQAHFLRLSVELEMAHVLAGQPDPSLAQLLLDLVEGQAACLATGDLGRFTELDMAFHRSLYEAAAVPDLWSMMRSRSGNLDRLRRLHLPLNGKAQSILAEHTRIARAIERGDAPGAQESVRIHLSGTLNAIDALRTRYPDLVLPVDYGAGSLAA